MASAVPPAAPSAPYPPSPAVAWPPPPPKKGVPAWATVVIIIVVVVVVLAALAAVLYVMVSGLLQTPGGNARPVVTLSTPQAVPNGFEFVVESANQARLASNYRVNLVEGGASGTATTLVPAMTFTIGANTYDVTWTDVGGEGSLTAGDVFRVVRPGGLVTADYTVRLFWSDGMQVAFAFYPSVGSKPVVTFSTPEAVTNGFRFFVVGTSEARPASDYRLNLGVGTSVGTAVVLAASMSFAIGGSTYNVTWTDLGGEGDLTAGDGFTVTKGGGLPPATEFTVFLLWNDGSLIQSASYTTP